MNRYKPHIYIIPEDDDDRRLANGFLMHSAVVINTVKIMKPADGWMNVLSTFERVYVKLLRDFKNAHVILLIDFDGFANRRAKCEQSIPDDVKPRVFLIGPWDEPKDIKRQFPEKLEEIGRQLADECYRGKYQLWDQTDFAHNKEERERLSATIRSFLFQSD